MEESDQRYGITGPASFKESSAESVRLGEELRLHLQHSDFFESEESAQTRERVLGRLDYLVKKFVNDMAQPGENKKLGGKIFTFGSYRLGVHDRGADIDALCVVPRHVHRKDFFALFYELLRADPGITDLSKIEDAFVPLIKMKFHGIPIDLTFARLNLPVIKDNINLLNDAILRAMDEKCIVSLNGSRVTDAILRLVPNKDVFHSALRAVKFWAKRRFVYGAAYGYFGGVAYALCVARVCQMYPALGPYDILCRFFEVFAAWKWPAPVLLTPVVDLNYHLKVWDPKIYPADKYHRMPVITPIYPSMCSTHNVTQSTCALTTAEFLRAHEILKSAENFSKIFDFTDFFKKHKLFVEIRLDMENKDESLQWNGYVESKVRILAMKLENVENVVAVVPFPKAFKTERDGAKAAPLVQADAAGKTDSAAVSLASEEAAGKVLDKEISAGSATAGEKPVETSNEADGNRAEHGAGGAAKRRAEPAENVKVARLSAPAVDGEEPCFSTRFFVAIDVSLNKNSEKKFYIDGPIKEFLDFLNQWEKKTPGMRIEIKSRRRREVQEFLKLFYDEE